MDKTDGSIISSCEGGTREDFLFTYSEQEKQENKKNKNNAGLIDLVDFYPIYTEYNGKMSLEAKVLMGFFRYRCKNGGKIYQSNEGLMSLLECSEDTVSKKIKELKELGLINYSIERIPGGGTNRLFRLNTTETEKIGVVTPKKSESYKNNYIYNYFNFDILGYDVIIIAELFENFPEEKLEQYKDILEDFVIYRCETDKKGTPRRKKEKTRNLGGRLAKRKKNTTTNFGRNKPQLPLEELQIAAVLYYTHRKTPEKQKKYEDFLKKYGVFDKRKEYANMKLGNGFIS